MYFNNPALDEKREAAIQELGNRCVLHPDFKPGNIRGRDMEAVRAAAKADREKNPAHIAWAKVQHIYGEV